MPRIVRPVFAGRPHHITQLGNRRENVFRPLHTRCAQRINRARGWKGHLWQGRYFSSALDEACLWAALRNVELNPVRAENYTWSTWLAEGEHADERDIVRRNVERGLP